MQSCIRCNINHIIVSELEKPLFKDIVNREVIIELKNDFEILRLELEARDRVRELKVSANHFISIEDLHQLKSTLKELRRALDDKHFNETEKENQFFEEATEKLKRLQRKHKLMEEIRCAWKRFDVPLEPDYLEKRKEGIKVLKHLKKRSTTEGDNAFSESDNKKLQNYTNEAMDLEAKMVHRDNVQANMRQAMDKKNYDLIAKALTEAEEAFFLDEYLLQECKELGDFLNPENRIQALRDACKSNVLDDVKKAISDYEKAKVTKSPGPEVLKQTKQRQLYLAKAKSLNERLREAMGKNDKDYLAKVLKQCHGQSAVKVEDIPLYSEAERQHKLMKSGDFKY